MLAPELRIKDVSIALESVCNGGYRMSELKIREMEQGEEFAAWFSDLLDDQDETNGTTTHVEERYLVLTSDIGDWIGGLRYTLRGGVAHLLELAVTPSERHQGYGHRLLHAFEEHATAGGAHLAEFWTEDRKSEALLAALGWSRTLVRANYIGGRTWYLLEKPLDGG